MSAVFYFLRRLTQPAYRIKGLGLGRICEAVRRWAAKHAPAAPLLITDFRGHAQFRCFLREHMGGQIFFRGSYSGEQLDLLGTLLHEDSVFVDVGANQGEFTVAAAMLVPKGRVYACEPVSEYRGRLSENIRLNGFRNVQILPVALGEQEGDLPIYDQPEDFWDGTRHEGLPTLFSSDTRRHQRELVAVKRLDQVVRDLGPSRIDVIKLDIEGAEWMALRGAADTLARYRPVLILEIGRETCRAAGYEPEALAQWLSGMGYRIEKIMDGGKTEVLAPLSLDDFQNVVAYPQ